MVDKKPHSLPRMAQLDGIRGIAAVVVVISHYPPGDFSWPMEIGVAAVYLFFVLSGFLITDILLKVRGLVDSFQCSRVKAFGVFYARRALRLTPAYYLAIFSLYCLNDSDVRKYFGYYCTYLANYVFFSMSINKTNHVWHLWSLSVEEQFYLVWPVLVLTAPRRWIVPIVATLILLAPLFRLYYYIRTGSGFKVNCPPWCSLDGLGLGALLALTSRVGPDWVPFRERILRVALLAGLLIMAGEAAVNQFHMGYKLRYLFANSGYALASSWLVSRAAIGFGGRTGWILASRPLVYLGTISYGIYLYHELLAPWGEGLAKHGLGHEIAIQPSPARTFVVLTVSIGVASASWHYFEQPIGRLKACFAYESEA